VSGLEGTLTASQLEEALAVTSTFWNAQAPAPSVMEHVLMDGASRVAFDGLPTGRWCEASAISRSDGVTGPNQSAEWRGLGAGAVRSKMSK